MWHTDKWWMKWIFAKRKLWKHVFMGRAAYFWRDRIHGQTCFMEKTWHLDLEKQTPAFIGLIDYTPPSKLLFDTASLFFPLVSTCGKIFIRKPLPGQHLAEILQYACHSQATILKIRLIIMDNYLLRDIVLACLPISP